MSAMTVFKVKKSVEDNEAGQKRDLLTPLNLHWAGVGLLALVILYLLVQMGLLWHAASTRDADAMTQQRVELKAAQVAAKPLRGLDGKLATSTIEADRFYRERLPVSDSEMLAELGALTKKTGVRLVRVSYIHTQVLPGTEGELTEVRMDATLSGDYRPLVLMMNSLERDKKFFLINGVTLTGQQSGNVNLRLRLTTYLRPVGTLGPEMDEVKAPTTAAAKAKGGPAQ
jgi:type IV pilus assembly protein PilO